MFSHDESKFGTVECLEERPVKLYSQGKWTPRIDARPLAVQVASGHVRLLLAALPG